MKFTKEMLRLYAVTDRGENDVCTLYRQIEQAILGGVTIVQLREKHLDEEKFIAEARQIKALCHHYHVPLIINDNYRVAIESGADGIHVGAEDMSVAEIRRKAGKDLIIGATAKTVEQAQSAERDGADYLGVGAVFASPTKQNALRITTEKLREICCSVSIPSVAIGGICQENVMQLKGSRISGIAVVSALFQSADIRRSAVALRELAESIVV